LNPVFRPEKLAVIQQTASEMMRISAIARKFGVDLKTVRTLLHLLSDKDRTSDSRSCASLNSWLCTWKDIWRWPRPI